MINMVVVVLGVGICWVVVLELCGVNCWVRVEGEVGEVVGGVCVGVVVCIWFLVVVELSFVCYDCGEGLVCGWGWG